jgi:hypothetical protein
MNEVTIKIKREGNEYKMCFEEGGEEKGPYCLISTELLEWKPMMVFGYLYEAIRKMNQMNAALTNKTKNG